MWQEGLLTYDELLGLGWEWQSVDGCMVKAPMGRGPTDRGKKETKGRVAVELHGLPIGIVLDGANRHEGRKSRE
jgi:putative transposase